MDFMNLSLATEVKIVERIHWWTWLIKDLQNLSYEIIRHAGVCNSFELYLTKHCINKEAAFIERCNVVLFKNGPIKFIGRIIFSYSVP